MAQGQGPSEADIIVNRTNVALARSQRLIQSWLPPKTNEELTASAKTEEELAQEDKEMFKPTPELLGLGAQAPDTEQEGLLSKRNTASNTRLLEQLLGKKAARGHRATKVAASSPAPQQTPKTVEQQSDDEEEGRASMVASKRSKPQPVKRQTAPKNVVSAKKDAPSSDDDEEDSRPAKKRPGSYLDQLLAEKASKKKKKQKN